jgi:hypothetical protein
MPPRLCSMYRYVYWSRTQCTVSGGILRAAIVGKTVVLLFDSRGQKEPTNKSRENTTSVTLRQSISIYSVTLKTSSIYLFYFFSSPPFRDPNTLCVRGHQVANSILCTYMCAYVHRTYIYIYIYICTRSVDCAATSSHSRASFGFVFFEQIERETGHQGVSRRSGECFCTAD